MNVLVDTSVWSLALRRRSPPKTDLVSEELSRLIADFRVAIIGPIRQELLSGIRSDQQFDSLRTRLQAFPDVPLDAADYELAARYFNRCRAQGIQGSNTDFLICAVAIRRRIAVFSMDKDFEAFERMLDVSMHRVGN